MTRPSAFLEELRDQGLDFTPPELEALASTDPGALRAFSETLDRRIRKASLGSGAAGGSP